MDIIQGLPANQLLHLDYPPITDGFFGPYTFPLGEGAFIQTDRNVTHTARTTPLFYDVDGDGNEDMFLITSGGVVAFRHSLLGPAVCRPTIRPRVLFQGNRPDRADRRRSRVSPGRPLFVQ